MEEKIRLQGDVLVSGGTLEGCIAALELRKAGKKVILAERRGSFGGEASHGLNNYLSVQDVQEEGKIYADALMKECSEKEGIDGPLFLDQKCRVWLGTRLREEGVQILTHVFPYECHVKDDLVQTVLEGKTGPVIIETGYAIDADSDGILSGLAGYSCSLKSKTVYGSIKWTDVTEDSVRSFRGETIEDCGDCLVRKIFPDDPVTQKGQTYGAAPVWCFYNRRYGELIMNSISIELASYDEFQLSDAYAGLRSYAYQLRDRIRTMQSGSPAAMIIFVSPILNQYGVKKYRIPEQARLINIQLDPYTNAEAINKGVEAAGGIIG